MPDGCNIWRENDAQTCLNIACNMFVIGIYYKLLHRDITTVRISAAYRDN